MPPAEGGMTVLCGYIPDKIPGIPERAALFAGRRYAECVGIGGIRLYDEFRPRAGAAACASQAAGGAINVNGRNAI